MKEQDLVVVLKDFAKRIDYARENMKMDMEKCSCHKHVKALQEAKGELLNVIDNSVASILGCFTAIEVIDEEIKRTDKKAEKLSNEEISKFDKE